MLRSDARELAVHLLYGVEFTGEEPEQAIDTRLEREYYKKLAEENPIYTERPSRKQMEYIDTVVSGVANREEELNGIIASYSIGWDIKRISRLARAAMQLAIFEAKYVEEIPVGVAISEAVRIIKKYDESAAPFVNGILGSFARGLSGQQPETREAAPEAREAAPEAEADEAAE